MTHALSPAHGTSHHDEPPLMAHGSVLQTGISNGKIAMWLFLGSEVMFFTGLIGAYIVLRFGAGTWADPLDPDYPLDIPLTAANTFLLICSSVSLVWALQGFQTDNRRQGNLGLLITTLIGAGFVGVQVYEYLTLWSHGMLPRSDLFASCFYAMTGFHGLHVAIGVAGLACLTVMGYAGRFNSRDYATVENWGLYWHFVDLVWIILFAIVYLM